MSISSEFVSVVEAAEILSSCEVFREHAEKGVRVRHLRAPGGQEVVLVEGASGEFLRITQR
jgi:hypothetical protein